MQDQKKISFYPGTCKGCQACVELLPECFGWDEDMQRPYLVCDHADEDRVRECMAYCPEECIDLDDTC